MRASIQFALNQVLQAHVLRMSGDTASEVALRKFEKRVDTSGIDHSVVELLRITDMHKTFCHYSTPFTPGNRIVALSLLSGLHSELRLPCLDLSHRSTKPVFAPSALKKMH